MSKRKHGRSGASTVEEDIDFAMNRGISTQRKRKYRYSILTTVLNREKGI